MGFQRFPAVAPGATCKFAYAFSSGQRERPGPDSLTFRSPDTVISLQSTFSLICDEPEFYNLASYLTCGLLLLAGAIRTLQSPFTKQNAWFALASVASLSLLPVYHRAYDAKLLLLTVPACALLWREGGRMKWLPGAMTTLAIASTSDIPATILMGFMIGMKHIDSLSGRLTTAFVFHPAPSRTSGDWQLLSLDVFPPHGSGERNRQCVRVHPHGPRGEFHAFLRFGPR